MASRHAIYAVTQIRYGSRDPVLAQAVTGAAPPHADDGRIEIDNSAAERVLRCIALSQRNFLFVGADSGRERAAAMCWLIGTVRLNGSFRRRNINSPWNQFFSPLYRTYKIIKTTI